MPFCNDLALRQAEPVRRGVSEKLAQFLRSNRNCDIELGEFAIGENSPLAGETERSIGERFPTIVFVAVRSQTATIPTRPGGSQSFAASDAVTVAGPRCDLEQVSLSRTSRRIRRLLALVDETLLQWRRTVPQR